MTQVAAPHPWIEYTPTLLVAVGHGDMVGAGVLSGTSEAERARWQHPRAGDASGTHCSEGLRGP